MASLTPLTLLIIFITIFFSLLKRRTEKRTNGLPPGPKKLPIIGNLHQLGELPHRTLQNLSKKFGDLMYLQLGSVPAIVISSSDMARDIFKNHDLVFSGRAPLYSSGKLTYNMSSVSTAPYGESWREMRKIMILELMTAKRVQSFEHVRAQEVANMIDRITNSAPNPIDLSALAFATSNNIVGRVAFGPIIDQDQNGLEFLKIFHDIQRIAAEFNVADYFPRLGWINRFNGVDKRLEKHFQDMDRFFNSVIEQHVDPRRPKQDHEDIVDVLLRSRQKDPNREVALTDEQIKGVLVDVFIGGTDTSSTTIEWTMSELIRNPKVREKVQQEIRQLCRDKARVEEDDLPKLTYLKQVIKESFRVHPPAPLLVPRETIDKCIIGNKYEISAKTRVIFNISAISMDSKYWENPNQFIPERFENSKVDYRGQHFELLPFGSGRRGCPGINFAIPLVELALANLLFCFDWELPKGMSVKDIDMMETVGITTHKKIPLRVVALPMK